jgi:hypothetical protein
MNRARFDRRRGRLPPQREEDKIAGARFCLLDLQEMLVKDMPQLVSEGEPIVRRGG